MKEIDFINNISAIIGNEYIGDDCAYLKDIGIVVTQDSLVENIHFKRDWCSFEQLGYKSVAVNISDILASGAIPAYITIALSLPKNITSNQLTDFYKGANRALYGAKIIGGDITGSTNDIMISITAIGKTEGRKISSRKNAKAGYLVVVKGEHGSSAAGLKELINGGNNSTLIKSHLEPELEYEFSKFLGENLKEDYAMMDTSDGLCDALFKIAQSSGVTLRIDYDKIPHKNFIQKEDVLFGGEDYKLIAVLPKDVALSSGGTIIGNAMEFDGAWVNISGTEYKFYDELKPFNHFE